MKRVDGVVGSAEDPAIAAEIEAHEERGTLETVTLDSADRRKSRLRVETDTGSDLGILVDKPELEAGDVLVLDEDRAVVVAFESREAFVIELPAPEESTLADTVELGHRIGNQHWDIAVEGRTVYIPVEADRAIIEDVLGPYLPADTETHYETVDAERFVDEASTDPKTEHDHSHETDHNHRPEHDHSHSHDGGHSHE